ncbi:MAG: hypothetical protein IJL67_03315 [Oscillospiraceae bacterium]|nr:hypothetical protein [Oscillospiraceae bacterium]
MNAEQLRDAIGKIDDRFIEEAEHYEPEIKSRKSIWIITSASAAVIALCTCVHFHNATEHALRPEIDNSVAVVTTAETAPQTDEAFTETSVYNGKITETIGPVSTDDMIYTSETVMYQTDVPENTTEQVLNTVSQNKISDKIQEPPEIQNSETEAPVTENHTATEINTESEETKSNLTNYPPKSVTEITDNQITDSSITDVPELLKRESFVSELKLVPGFTDKIYRIKYDAEKADGHIMMYDVQDRKYLIDSPDAYTICIYDVVIDGDDHDDFLNKGNYILKTENEYTVDEYFALDDQVISVEELISSGFYAVEYSTGSEND